MNADVLQGEAVVDEAFDAELIAYSRLSRDAVRREAERSDAEELLPPSGCGDETEVLWTVRVIRHWRGQSRKPQGYVERICSRQFQRLDMATRSADH
jgi:hypothetical protein